MDTQSASLKKLAGRFNLHYGIVQSAYWMAYGCLVSFAAVLLQAKGFAIGSVGIILALSHVISIVLQPRVAAWIDRNHTIRLNHVIAAISGAAVLCCLLLFFCEGRVWAAGICFVGAAMLHITNQALVNALGMETVEKGVPINYGLSRSTGSITFAIMFFFMGSLVETLGEDVLIFSFSALGILLVLSVLLYRPPVQKDYRAKALSKNSGNPVEFFRKYPAFGLALVGVVCMHASHAYINNYMIAIAEKCGGSSSVTGISIAIAALTELPVLIIFDRLLKKWRVDRLLAASAVGYGVRAALVLLASTVPMLYFAQCFHIVGYALFLPSIVHFSRVSVKSEDLVQGQAYGGMAISMAGILGSLTGGFLIDGIGVNGMLAVAVVLPVIGLLILLYSRKKAQREA
ncbi:MAG: MFS transporter [Clostridiales bacterium]|nr:MFS transporter [Clostridiales bacterium]